MGKRRSKRARPCQATVLLIAAVTALLHAAAQLAASAGSCHFRH
jgi:hypothetical protein